MRQSKKKKELFGTSEVKRYLGALSENFTHQVKGIAEQYTDLKKDISKINKTVESHTEMIGKILVDVTVVKEDASVLKKDVSVIKGDISLIKNDLKQKVDREEFALLERRVLMLEKKY